MDMLEQLSDIVFAVQDETKYPFDLSEIFRVMQHTLRKIELNGQGDGYIPILFRNELQDLVMRHEINKRGSERTCVVSAIPALV